MAKKDPSAEQLTAFQHVAVACINAIGNVSNRMGMPTAILILCLTTVYIFGDADTRNQFIRALIFEPTKEAEQPVLRWFFGIVLSCMIATPLIRWWMKRSENTEMGRLRARISKLEAERLPTEDEESETESPKKLKAGKKDEPARTREGVLSQEG